MHMLPTGEGPGSHRSRPGEGEVVVVLEALLAGAGAQPVGGHDAHPAAVAALVGAHPLQLRPCRRGAHLRRGNETN